MANQLPKIPQIEGDYDLLLDVFTHTSLKFRGAPLNDEYGDTERLAELGGKVLELIATQHFFWKKPFLSSTDMTTQRDASISNEELEKWFNVYALKSKIRCDPNVTVDSPQEMRRFFTTYVGALYIRNGMRPVQDWISRLIDPDVEPVIPPETSSGSNGQVPAQQSYPQPPRSPTPTRSLSPTSNDGVQSLISLALVNQTASQKGVQISYLAEQVGPSHQPTWTIRCIMNGNERGRGIGKSQKIAKEEAARQAFASMGWGPRA